ncbi:MAG: hypothetical protein LKG15_07980 [Corynebacterium provencense]|uniref:hypothetical protein n=1 Tax=Corynebacterium provencense TaxID=1737425 RepID=UPI002989BC67|nr:hypothetical protein [Corynebacterium provencense]
MPHELKRRHLGTARGPGDRDRDREPGSPPEPPATRDAVTGAISWLGATFLVIGLVFLTVQAVDQQWIEADVAVVMVTVLSLTLTGAALAVHVRAPQGPVAPAVLTAGVLGLYAVIMIMALGLQWFSTGTAASLTTAAAVLALGIARVWDRQWLVAVLLAAGVPSLTILTSVIALEGSHSVAGAGGLLLLGLAGWTSALRRAWIAVDAVAAVVFMTGISYAPLGISLTGATAVTTAAAITGVGVVALAGVTGKYGSASTAVVASLLTRWIPASAVPVAALLLYPDPDPVGRGTGGIPAAAWCALGVAVLTCAVPVARELTHRDALTAPARPVGPAHRAPGVPVFYPGYPPSQAPADLSGRLPAPTPGRSRDNAQGHPPAYLPAPAVGTPAPPPAPAPATPGLPPYPGWPPPPLPQVSAAVADSMRTGFCTGTAATTLALTVLYVSTAQFWWPLLLIALLAAMMWFTPPLPSALYRVLGVWTLLVSVPLLIPAWDPAAGYVGEFTWLPALLYLPLAGLVLGRAIPLHLTQTSAAVVAGVLLVAGSSALPLIARTLTDTGTSFMVGHLTVSVLWMLTGVYLLTRVDATAGLGVTALATAKLVLFDLSTLDGLIQVAAFILCGLILLVCAAFRERGGRRAEQEHTPPASPAS